MPLQRGAEGGLQLRRRHRRGEEDAGVAAVGNTVYVAGGYARGNVTSALWSYDTAKNRWGELSPLPQPRAALGLAVLNGRLHAIGGYRGGSVTDHEVYDPGQNTWQRAASLPVGRDHLCVAVLNGKIYAIGGRINTSFGTVLSSSCVSGMGCDDGGGWPPAQRFPAAGRTGAASTRRRATSIARTSTIRRRTRGRPARRCRRLGAAPRAPCTRNAFT